MTDLRKAAEMALEALEKQHNWMVANDGMFQIPSRKAIQALRQALAEPANSTTDFVEPKTSSQSEQEPECVAVIGNWGKVEWKEGVFPQLGGKLYTAPPKREWVGLTRRELDIATLGLEDLGDCYLAIEAKLKEKNT